MVDLSVSGLNKYYGEHHVLRDVSFAVQRGERVGMVGGNGTGKTTLFKILSGELDYDSGEIAFPAGVRVAMIEQIPKYPPEYTVEQVLRTSFAETQALADDLRALEERMAQGDAGEEVMRSYSQKTARFEHLGGYDTEVALNMTTVGLGITPAMRSQLFSRLSGGEKTRISLAQAILKKADVLLLDEPTNHLDMDAVEWLENYISKYEGTVIVISHDRLFLDRCVTRIIEMTDTGGVEFYAGNYSFYVKERQERYDAQMKKYLAEQKKAAELQFTADRMHGWGMGNKKLQVRAFAIEKRIERITKTEKPQDKRRTLRGSFTSREFYGDRLMEAKGLGLTLGDKRLFEELTFQVQGGEKIGLIGDNGCGKTSLLKVICGEIPPDHGYVRFGPTVKIGILPQNIEFEDESRNLVDTLIYELNMTPQTARNHLAAFDFTGDEVFDPVSTLSGGERSRLKLCILMCAKVNFLILDEPTNHLDIPTREWIEDAVEQFDGTLLFVSHDRYFINRFANRIWHMTADGVEDWHGGFEEYRRAVSEGKIEDVRATAPEPVKEKKEKPKDTSRAARAAEKRAGIIEREIAACEENLKALEAEMEEKATDYGEVERIYGEMEELKARISELYEKWEQEMM